MTNLNIYLPYVPKKKNLFIVKETIFNYCNMFESLPSQYCLFVVTCDVIKLESSQKYWFWNVERLRKGFLLFWKSKLLWCLIYTHIILIWSILISHSSLSHWNNLDQFIDICNRFLSYENVMYLSWHSYSIKLHEVQFHHFKQLLQKNELIALSSMWSTLSSSSLAAHRFTMMA